MCGRYVRRSDKQKIAEWFHADPNPVDLPMPDADYNVAPTTHQPLIRQSRETGDRELILTRWGLVPFFTKDLKDVKCLTTINARSETITTAPTWREPFKKNVVSSQFPRFTNGRRKESRRSSPTPSSWRTVRHSPLRACGTLGTTGRSLAPILCDRDDRSERDNEPATPAHAGALHARDYDRWLDREGAERLPLDLLRPYESDEMEVYEANPKVGNVRNNGPEMTRVAAKAAEDGEPPL